MSDSSPGSKPPVPSLKILTVPPQVKDPVCGMAVVPEKAAAKIEHAGKTYYFCSKGCAERFSKETEKFLAAPGLAGMNHASTSAEHGAMQHSGTSASPDATDEKKIRYTCPMHPEIIRRGPGSCPICGMALEPMDAFAEVEADPEYESMRLRFWISAVLSLPLLLLSMLGDLIGVHLTPTVRNSIEFFLATPVVLWGGWPFFERFWSSLVNRSPNMFTLIGLGTGAAYFESVIATFFPQVFPASFRGMDGGAPVYFEGASAIDESMVTGEPMPVEKSTGDKVTGGTLNTSGSFIMEAERVGSETMLAQIVKLVGEAQRSRAPMQRLADRVGAYFVPAVIVVAILAFAGWILFGPEPRFAHALVAAVSVLIIACPCALGLATPMSIMVAVGRGAHVGVLVRNAEALETLAKVDTLVIDKTGTLTEGKPTVWSIQVFDGAGLSHDELLSLTASVEQASEHPLARAIVRAAQEKKLLLASPTEFRAIFGSGVEGWVLGKKILAGTAAFLRDRRIDLPDLQDLQAQATKSSAVAPILVAVEGRLAGVLFLSDAIRASTPEAIRALRDDGIRIVMLTGDRRETAIQVARELQIEEAEAEVLPQQKGEIVKRLREQGHIVAMAGDGINDAPALAAADVGIAMGTGTDVAIENAGITLVKGDLRGIVRARKLSHATIRNIKQNLLFAFLYNVIGIPVAAGVFYPLFGWLLSPMLASPALSCSSVSVIANAMRLRQQ